MKDPGVNAMRVSVPVASRLRILPLRLACPAAFPAQGTRADCEGADRFNAKTLGLVLDLAEN